MAAESAGSYSSGIIWGYKNVLQATCPAFDRMSVIARSYYSVGFHFLARLLHILIYIGAIWYYKRISIFFSLIPEC